MGIRDSQNVRIVRSKIGSLPTPDKKQLSREKFDVDAYIDWGTQLLMNFGYEALSKRGKKILDLPWTIEDLLNHGYSSEQLQFLYDFFDGLLLPENASPNGFDRYVQLGLNGKSHWILNIQQLDKNSRIIVSLDRQKVGDLSFIPQGSFSIQPGRKIEMHSGSNSAAQRLLLGLHSLLLDVI